MLFSGIIISFGLLFGGCVVSKPASVQVQESPTVTITGVIKMAGEKFTITPTGSGGTGVPARSTELTSRKIDLSVYNEKNVTVTGEYSGTTLYVDEVK